MRKAFLGLLFLLLCACLSTGLSACQPVAATPLPPTETPTPPLPTETPTTTPVWFPPTPTNTPYPTPYITPTVDVRVEYGNLIFADNFTVPENWSLFEGGSGTIAVVQGELTIAVSRSRTYLYSLRQATNLKDFYAEVTASPSICRGADEYGMLLRVSPAVDFYRFSLTCKGQVRLDRYLNGKASSPQPLTLSGAVPPGAPSQSRLAVSARGSEMSFFANQQYLFTIRDPALTSGTLGFFARTAGEDPMTVNFTDLAVYQSKP